MTVSILPAILQTAQGTSASSSTTLKVSIPNVTQGSALFAYGGIPGGGEPTFTFSDNINGSWTTLDNVINTNAFASCAQGVRFNSKGGTPTVTLTASGSQANLFLLILEIAGVLATDGHTGVEQDSPGTGANALTVGPPAPNNKLTPAIVLGGNLGFSVTASTVGTGYTAYNSFNVTGTSNLFVEYAILFSGISSAVKFTATAGTGQFNNMVSILDIGYPSKLLRAKPQPMIF